MTTADLARDVTYLETISRAVADTSAKLVADVTDLRARLEKLPTLVTDVRIGPGEYHACPRDLAPMKQLWNIADSGGLVLVEDSKRNLCRLMGYDADKDAAIVTPMRGEVGRQTIPKAGTWVYGYVFYLKLSA
jgi:hypothetical protein